MAVPNPATWVSGFVDAADFNVELRDNVEWVFDPPRILTGRSSGFDVGTGSADGYRALNWNTEVYKVGITHSNVSNTRALTIDTPGMYFVWANVEFGAVASTTGQRRIDLALNGAAGPTGTSTPPAGAVIFASQNTAPVAASIPGMVSVQGTYEAQVGDFFQVLCYQSSGVTLTVTTNSTFGALWLAGLS